MPDDVGGKPFPDDGEPDDDRGGADQDFASVVFDEDFVRNAEIHEPSAAERQRAADRARAEAEAARVAGGWAGEDDYGHPDGYALDDPSWEGGHYGCAEGPYGAYGGSLRPYRGRAGWLRPVAWVLAVVMGLGMVALAFSAVYRSAAGEADPAPAPASTPLGEVAGVGAFTYPVGRQP
ncbi:membrane protein [Streptomyces sp. RSD-27]|nr:membrane protein [Streptomyces sp. RSD-27]